MRVHGHTYMHAHAHMYAHMYAHTYAHKSMSDYIINKNVLNVSLYNLKILIN